MTEQMTSTKKNGFVYSGVSESQNEDRSPIYGYRDLFITSLEESVEDIALYVPSIKTSISLAKQKCYKKNPDLTIEESAAIYLYTMPTSFHDQLNDRLRAENRHELKPWLAFLKLFISALTKLPTLPPTTVWRGVANDLSSNFINNPLQTWWTVNSCSKKLEVVERYLGRISTVFSIKTIYGKDISLYSAFPAEQEVILMPGTRVQVMSQLLKAKDTPYIVSLEECTTIPQGKHVMLSYHSNDHKIVSEIHKILREAHIPVWFEERRDLVHNIRDCMADGVEDAVVVCCFITPDYAESIDCQCELQYAQKRGRRIIPCLLSDTKPEQFSNWLKRVITGLKPIDFHDISESNIQLKAHVLIYQIADELSASQYLSSKASDRPSYLFELIRQKHQRNSRIERIMNPSKSFPIEQSYINLAIVNAKEHQEKEKQLLADEHTNSIISAYEEVYGMKTIIDVKNIFDRCNTQEKQVLVSGRAGIGKSTFSRYVAYQWATSSYWPQYELLALIPLRRLTSDRYPPDKNYSLIDLVQKEVFQSGLSEKDDMLLKNQFDSRKTLWILDGYDEIVQNVPTHLKFLFEQLLNTPHHILTSRPYLNTLWYNVQMEITGFTDENIKEYVQQFFEQMQDEFDDASIRRQALFRFLKSNSSIWGVAHIPIYLELICSCWSNEDWSETKQLTITTLYSMITEWLCRRYLRTQDDQILQLSKEEIEQCCQKELTFLESLAFNAMESNTIILQPHLLKKAVNEAKTSSKEHPHILNIGVLKSFTKQGIGNRIEMNKDHYFIHLSFQEYFAARYLINILNGSSNQTAIELIKRQKYNQRFTSVFIFASGLLSEIDVKPTLNIFWFTMLEESFDLVGIRHIQLVVACIEETTDKSLIPQYSHLLEWIVNCIKYNIIAKNEIICNCLTESLQRAPSIASDEKIMNTFVNLIQHNDDTIKIKVLSFISTLDISNPSSSMINSITVGLEDENEDIRRNACNALEKIGEKAVTNEVITKLVITLGDKSTSVRRSACEALGMIGKKVVTNEMIIELVNALENESADVKRSACEVLGMIGEKAAMNKVISKLLSALEDEDDHVRIAACKALQNMGEMAATNEVVSKLVSALEDKSVDVKKSVCDCLGMISEKIVTNEMIIKLATIPEYEDDDVILAACNALQKISEKVATNKMISILLSVIDDASKGVRRSACECFENIHKKRIANETTINLEIPVWSKDRYVRISIYQALGNMGEKAATNEVISTLLSALEDEDIDVRLAAHEALQRIDERAATSAMITKLVHALEDGSADVRRDVCNSLGLIGENAATDEVISKLVSALDDINDGVGLAACEALGNIGEKAATNEVISKLLSMLDYNDDGFRVAACEALGNIGEKAATDEVISKLLSILDDYDDDVKVDVCEALGNIGEKAATDEVISKLLSALDDYDDGVRAAACRAVENIGEKAATDEVISKLLGILEDDDDNNVRLTACQVVESIGEKAITNEVIDKLVIALDDEDEYVRRSVCECLRNIDEKTATNEMISKLLSALGNEHRYVRVSVCEVLGNIGEKAATDEVISKLVSMLDDYDDDVRVAACQAVDNIGKKAATNEVISKLMLLVKSNMHSDNAQDAICNVLSSFAATIQLDHNIISDLLSSENASYYLQHVSEEQFIDFFLTNENFTWLPILSQFALLKRVALIVTNDTIMVYGKKEPSELKNLSLKYRQQLIKVFTDQRKQLHLYFTMSSETEKKIHCENDERKMPNNKRQKKNNRIEDRKDRKEE